jgi:hypothetical protein
MSKGMFALFDWVFGGDEPAYVGEPTVPIPGEQRLTAEQFGNEVIALYHKHREDFGLCDHDFPGEGFGDRQMEFENEFAELICRWKGHRMFQDHCGKPEHDSCANCNLTRERLVSQQTTECMQ